MSLLFLDIDGVLNAHEPFDPATVRRDLRAMVAEGLLGATRGGAVQENFSAGSKANAFSTGVRAVHGSPPTHSSNRSSVSGRPSSLVSRTTRSSFDWKSATMRCPPGQET